jgi:hypothetical protein
VQAGLWISFPGDFDWFDGSIFEGGEVAVRVRERGL